MYHRAVCTLLAVLLRLALSRSLELCRVRLYAADGALVGEYETTQRGKEVGGLSERVSTMLEFSGCTRVDLFSRVGGLSDIACSEPHGFTSRMQRDNETWKINYGKLQQPLYFCPLFLWLAKVLTLYCMWQACAKSGCGRLTRCM